MLLGGYTYTVPKKVSERESSAKLNNVRIGMAKAEVQSILGAPDSTSAQANAEYMVCYLELPDHVDTDLGDRPYIVRLVNGKVESFGRFAELLDLYDRPVTGTLPGQSDLPQAADSPGNPPMPPPAIVRTGSQIVQADLATELETLRALKDQKVLTDAEFQDAKARLLSRP